MHSFGHLIRMDQQRIP